MYFPQDKARPTQHNEVMATSFLFRLWSPSPAQHLPMEYTEILRYHYDFWVRPAPSLSTEF